VYWWIGEPQSEDSGMSDGSTRTRTNVSNVLVIGSGAAGLRAAIAAHEAGSEAVVIGTRPRKDAHTVLAAGGINAALGTRDPEDSWQQHFADTLKEGYLRFPALCKSKRNHDGGLVGRAGAEACMPGLQIGHQRPFYVYVQPAVGRWAERHVSHGEGRPGYVFVVFELVVHPFVGEGARLWVLRP